MNKLAIIILVIAILVIAIFAVQLAVNKNLNIWPIGQVFKMFGAGTGNSDSGDSETGLDRESREQPAESSGNEASQKLAYDIDDDGILSCELMAQENYIMTENHVEINAAEKNISFDFQKKELESKIHPDNFPSVVLKHSLYPENPDKVFYSNIFLADDNKLYICY